LFVDGDRGGKLIAKNVCDNAKVMEIAQAPDGKEVEELTGKEILQALRRKVKPKEFLFKMERDSGTRTRTRTEFSQRRTRTSEEPTQKTTRTKSLTKDEVSKVANLESELKSRNVLILNSDLETIRNVPSSKLDFLRVSDVFVLVTNSANSKIISSAEKFGAKYVFAKSFQKIDETSIELISI
jgi:DNA primase